MLESSFYPANLDAMDLVLMWKCTNSSNASGSASSSAALGTVSSSTSKRPEIGQIDLTDIQVLGHTETHQGIKISVECEQEIEHDFSQSSICQMKLQVRIKNWSRDSVDRMLFETLQTDSQSNLPSKRSHFFFTGKTTKAIYDLEANQEVVVSLKACFAAPGVYNVNRVRVTINHPSVCKGAVDSSTVQSVFLPVERLVVCRDKSNKE
eukprot:TRINITY_DN26322_c0_g1_i1.p1 TRINITY_DN26322_c0_g1~~TRINITY_DN26322_c0_g1_i1.p1  ORF type:complete len:243 (+),score=69.74 TRINITY_DN26322_c0_g1_i1:106-729(+)